MLKISVIRKCCKITYWNLPTYLPGANELKVFLMYTAQERNAIFFSKLARMPSAKNKSHNIAGDDWHTIKLFPVCSAPSLSNRKSHNVLKYLKLIWIKRWSDVKISYQCLIIVNVMVCTIVDIEIKFMFGDLVLSVMNFLTWMMFSQPWWYENCSLNLR